MQLKICDYLMQENLNEKMLNHHVHKYAFVVIVEKSKVCFLNIRGHGHSPSPIKYVQLARVHDNIKDFAEKSDYQSLTGTNRR